MVTIAVDPHKRLNVVEVVDVASTVSACQQFVIARGDLAVEINFERMAEVPREILALCEAGHVPSIRATQVLESLAKTGAPSRAETTDVAVSQRADCVMLNKGLYILSAIDVLDGRVSAQESACCSGWPGGERTHRLRLRSRRRDRCCARLES